MSRLLIDDRILVDGLTSGQPFADRCMTTPLWHYRACRAAVVGAGGQLSGPFLQLDPGRQRAAILELLRLPGEIELPDMRRVVPQMARLAQRHGRLNVMNLQATATAAVHEIDVALSPKAASGVLPAVLDEEQIGWQVVEIS